MRLVSRIRACFLAFLSLLRTSHSGDGCSGERAELIPAWSCRYASATRQPTIMIPLEALDCTTKPLSRCQARRGNWTNQEAVAPLLYVALTTIPPRSGAPLARAVHSIFNQRRVPDKVIVSAAAHYKRFGNKHADLTSLAPHATSHGVNLETNSTCEDLGPGTKLICPLPRLRQLHKAHEEEVFRAGGRPRRAFAVLLDDDLRYKPWALSFLDNAIRADPGGERRAYSYDVYTLTPDGHAVRTSNAHSATPLPVASSAQSSS